MDKEHWDLKRMRLVGRYATPLAIFLVGAGVLFAQPTGMVRAWSLGLLVFGILFNLGFSTFMSSKVRGFRRMLQVRILVNLAGNGALVYLLAPFWPPIWLLLALTPFATAIYSTAARTLVASTVSGVMLVVIRAAQPGGAGSPLEWGVVGVQVLFIFLMSLMIHELAAQD